MSKDHDYIKKLFENDSIAAPESLSEENMLAMLSRAEEEQTSAPAEQIDSLPEENGEKVFEKKRIKARPNLKKWMAAAAAAIVAVFGISGLNKVLNAPPDISAADGELYTFKSQKEIERLISSMDSSGYGLLRYRSGSSTEETIDYETEAVEDASFDTGTVSNSATPKSSEEGSYSETYLQVEDVDEADIVKTDGKYIYYVTDRRETVILSAEDGKTKKLSTIGSGGIENYINDIYLKGDKLITVGTYYKDDSNDSYTGIVVYDISDRSAPHVLYDFSQTGSILSSRMVGDYVYLVTNDYVSKGGRIVPVCGAADDLIELKASDICSMPSPSSTSYIVLSAVDISSGASGTSATKAVFGASSEIYCNSHNLYATSTEWSDDSSSYYTRIVRANLDGLNVKFSNTNKVRGYLNSQFAMDESDGYFRIATTSDRAGISVNNLYVLDTDLKETGKVTGFARNESIRAVRFIGSKAYVITYEAIDPLFIIDLSDPSDPRIEGEVKIDGFSTLLIPVSADRLLGIGYATGDNGYGGEYASGLKLALFDISDPSEPKVLDSKEFENMSSLAQSDHHALMVNSEAGYFAIPFEVWNDAAIEEDEVVDDVEIVEDAEIVENTEETLDIDALEDIYYTGVLLFKAGDRITQVDRHSLDSEMIYRSVYIGDWVYALDGEGNVQSFKPAF